MADVVSRRRMRLVGLTDEQRNQIIQMELARTREVKRTTHVFRRSDNAEIQMKRHGFLLEHKRAIDAILARVGQLMAETPFSTDFSADDKECVLNWMDEVDLIFHAFVPGNGDARRDPLGRMIDKLTWLNHSSYVCLTQVGIEAKALVLQWEHDGAFDDVVSGQHISFDDMEANATDFARRVERRVRRRAAARLIRRNVQRFLLDGQLGRRVEEFRVFGNTFYKHIDTPKLRLQSTRLVMLDAAQEMPKGRNHHAHGITLDELKHLAWHVSTFKVDDAIRQVEIATRKRHLFEHRCALKVQAAWHNFKLKQIKMIQLIEKLRQHHAVNNSKSKTKAKKSLVPTKSNTKLNVDTAVSTVVHTPRKPSKEFPRALEKQIKNPLDGDNTSSSSSDNNTEQHQKCHH
ncbi:unnamed protein product [Aphanomyces euteiches]